ncbi:MAG: NAD(P)H-dependent oxidoreductase [Actinomycetota bacterium]
MPQPLSVLGISGSLRRASFNTAALRVAVELAPEGMAVEVATLHGIPNFDADVEAAGLPPEVRRLREAMTAADALLIATPEYNWSIPGVLKNALDWASRGGEGSPLRGKPAAVLGAGGRFGTLRAQVQLREILRHNRVRVVGLPEVMIDAAETRFDDAGRLTDERFRGQIRRLLEALAEEARRDR